MKVTLSQVSRGALAGLALAGSLAFAVPAAAQADDARLRKIESEIRALQRKVFPNGDGRFFTPEVITPNGQQPPPNTVGTPSETAVTDILARLDALEAQLARLTARSEENSNKIAQLESKIADLAAPAPAPAPVDAGEPRQPTGVLVAGQSGSPASGASKPAPKPTLAPTPTPTATAPSPERLAAVKAIEKPDTGKAGEDEYIYGFRLWDAGFYPEAEQQLKMYVEKYPNDGRISYGRNLLGRAYLDDGQPRTAATYFFENYTKDPTGPRGADSLLYLAEAMIALKDTPRACRALAEFGDKFPALASGRLEDQYEKDRKAVDCS
jgi:TolA-binding protein